MYKTFIYVQKTARIRWYSTVNDQNDKHTLKSKSFRIALNSVNNDNVSSPLAPEVVYNYNQYAQMSAKCKAWSLEVPINKINFIISLACAIFKIVRYFNIIVFYIIMLRNTILLVNRFHPFY